MKFILLILLSEMIRKIKSVKEYSDKHLTLFEVSQLLFFAQGITDSLPGVYLRAAFSAGTLYPIEIYLFVQNVEGLEKGV